MLLNIKYVRLSNIIGIDHNIPFLFFIIFCSFKLYSITNIVGIVNKITDIPGLLCQKSIDCNILNNKLPYKTPKCAAWKDAYKASGSFYSLQNFVRFHHVILEGCNNKYDSEQKLYHLLDTEFKGCEWKFHQLLVDTIKYNNFNLRRSIADGNKADGTTSTRALVYKR